jgi:hypothetical protein
MSVCLSMRSRGTLIALLAGATLLVSSAARAHGGAPAALGIVAVSENGPSVVLLNEGLAVQREDRWSFLCPRLWGDANVASGKVPLALSVDGVQTWVVGADDLYAALSGNITAQSRPDLTAADVVLLARGGDELYGLRIARETGGSEVVRVGAAAEAPLWTSPYFFSALVVHREQLQLARLANDLEVAFATLDRQGRLIRESSLVTDRISDRVELQPTPSRLFAVTHNRATSRLHALGADGSSWQTVFEGEGVLYGPVASPDGRLWIALDGDLMRESGTTFESVADGRPLTCLGQWGNKAYACAGSEMYWLTDDGLGERFFQLAGFSGPDPKVVSPMAQTVCEFQWVLYRNDLELVGLAPRDWAPAVQQSSPDAGGSTAIAGMGAAAASSAAANGSSSAAPSLARRADDGCSVAAPRAAQKRGALFSLWCVGWLAIAIRRRRIRRVAALALLLPLVFQAGSSAVSGQSSPAYRVDLPNAAHRALAVATYDAGEVTVGEIEDAIAASSPLVQQDALEPAALRAFLARSLQFELMALEAERRGYGNKPPVLEAIKQNAVHALLAREVDGNLKPDAQALEQPKASPERDALIEGLIAELRKTEPRIARPELLELIQIEAGPDDSAVK